MPTYWSAAWGGLADEFVAAAEAATDPAEQQRAWWQAYQAAFIGRYPVPNHPLKAELYDRARAYFARATALETPAVEVIELPFAGRPGDGDRLRFYLTRPDNGDPRPPADRDGIHAERGQQSDLGRPDLRARAHQKRPTAHVVSGELYVTNGETQAILRPGDTVVNEPGDPHAWKAFEDTVCVVFVRGQRAGEEYESDTVRLDEPLIAP